MTPSSSAQTLSPLSRLQFASIKPVPLVLQTEMSECGLACLAMVASYYGHRVNLTALRKHLTLGTQGMNLKQLMNVANELHLTSRAVQCEVDELEQLKTPCVLHWDLDHFVVLTRVSKKWIYLNDPARGKRVLSRAQFSQSYTGVALELLPNSHFRRQDQRIVMKMSQLWSKIIGLKRSLLSLFLLSMLLQMCALLTPYYMQWVVDNVLLSHDQNLLLVLAVGFAMLTLVQVGVSAFRSWLVIRFSSSLNIQMGANLFHHLCHLSMAYFEKRHIGDIVSRFGSLSAIRELLTTGLIEAVIDGLMALTVLVMMFLYHPTLAWLVLGIVLLSFFLQLAFYYPNRRLTEESIVAKAQEDSSFLESVRTIQTIKLFSHETYRKNSWLNRYADVLNADIRLGKLAIAEDALNAVLFGLETILVVYFGALLVMEETLTVGMLLAFIAYKNQFTSSILALIDNLLSFKLLGLHLERLSDITLSKREHSGKTRLSVKQLKGEIRVENLSFRYSDHDPWVLRHINLVIHPGESVAITGVSGCGKSTLMKLILGLYQPTQGAIYLDGIDIRELSVSDYRQHIGSVMQNDQLLAGTVGENITMFDSHYDEARLEASCKQARIYQDIQALPMRFHSLVGDMGNHFSGGQLQRLFLARALYKQPTILCLDESTSHLDQNNEQLINQQIRQLKITRLVIAHRQETIDSTDRVIHLPSVSP